MHIADPAPPVHLSPFDPHTVGPIGAWAGDEAEGPAETRAASIRDLVDHTPPPQAPAPRLDVATLAHHAGVSPAVIAAHLDQLQRQQAATPVPPLRGTVHWDARVIGFVFRPGQDSPLLDRIAAAGIEIEASIQL